MELTPLKYFAAVAAEGHMTRAARALGVTQPALSASLAKLEREVGAPLLTRTGRGVELTDAGRVFLAHAGEALREAEAGVRAVREVMGLERGSIRVGAGATAVHALIPPVVSAVLRKHPNLRFYVREAGSGRVAADVASGELDLGIVTLPVPPALAGELTMSPLVEDELRLIVPPGHRLESKRSFRFAELSGEPMVAFEAGSAVREVVERAAASAGVELRVVMELRSIESIKRMVSAGIGLGLVSRFALAGREGLTCRDARLARRLALVKRADRRTGLAAHAFERAVLDAYGSRAQT